ncbi:MAG: ABC transporter ATP-binding protein [Lactobacillus sp.]|jgi:putative ABC transport system ATP-binding protein|nr:ABC transporter ATP-binding protein [Lactobacillus sp.]
MALIELHQVTKTYGQGHKAVQALKPTDFQLMPSEFLAITGPSGSGKTTLLTIIGHLQQASSGSIQVNGQDTSTYSAKQLTKLRFNEFGFILQASNLIPFLTVNDQFKLVDRLTNKGKLSQTPTALLDLLGIGELKDKFPNQLSGGERQRVAIARALYNDPDIILADEPTASLDTSRALQTVGILAQVAHDLHRGVIMITHDTKLLDDTDGVYDMRDGQLTQIK